MSLIKRLALVVSLLLLASSGMCAETQDYIDQAQKVLSQKNIRSMMDVSKTLKEYGASYQQVLLLPTDLSQNSYQKTNAHLLIGAYQFDALYAASFGRKDQAAKDIKAMGTLLNTTNMKSIADTSALYPPELNWMLREPDAVNIDEVIDAYAANAPKYKDIMASKQGFALTIDSIYGSMVEGLYIATRSAVLMDDRTAANSILNGFQNNINLVLNLYAVFENNLDYADSVDVLFLERSQRVGWMESLAEFLTMNKGNITMEHIKAIGRFVTRERMRLVYNEFNEVGFD